MSKTAPVTVMSPGQMRMAEKLNDRITDLRKAEITANKKAAVLRVENRFRRKFGLAALERKVNTARRRLDDLQEELRVARQEMGEAMHEELAKIEEKFAGSIFEENTRATTASIQVLAHSLPADLRDALAVDDTMKLLKG